MKVAIIKEQAVEIVPDVVDRVMKQLNAKRPSNSKSSMFQVNPSDWDWCIDFAMTAKVASFSDIFSQIQKYEDWHSERTTRLSRTVDERVDDWCSRIVNLSIAASYARIWPIYVKIDEVPDIVRKYFMAQAEKDYESDKFFLSMTPKEKAQKTTEILGNLGKSPGFVGIKFGK